MTEYCLIDLPIKIKKSPINAICYSQLLNLVAVGRENGLVEIYDYTQNFFLLTKVIVSNTQEIDGLKFMNIGKSVKLFGITALKLFEIDINKNYVKQELNFSNKIAARSIVQANDKIIIGCDNGSINVYEYISEISFLQIFHNASEAISSLSYSKLYKNFLYAGCTGRLYKINMTTFNAEYFEIVKEKDKSTPNIWCMEFLGKYLCTGDTNGMINIWNAENFGNIRSFSSHKASILCMSVSGSCLYASGTDPEIVKLELNGDEWVETKRHYGMVSDIRALCTTEKYLIAGGLGCDMTVYDINSKLENRSIKHKIIESPPFPIEIHSLKPAETYIAFIERNKSVVIRQISTKSTNKISLGKIEGPGKSHLQAWSVSKSLQYFVYSTNIETRILKMRFIINESHLSVDFKRFNAPEFLDNSKSEGTGVCLPPAYILKFIEIDNEVYLILVESSTLNMKSDNNSKLLIYEINPNLSFPVLKATILAKEENYFNGVHKICASENGKYIAFSTLDGFLFIYSIKRMAIIKKVARQESNELPKVLSMDFNSIGDRLIVIYSNKKIADMDLGQKVATKWTNSFNSNLRKEWLNLNPRTVQFNGQQSFYVLMNRNLLVKIDMEKPAIVPIQVPLFSKRQSGKAIKKRGLKSESLKLQSKIFKTDKILQLTDTKGQEVIKKYEKIKNRYQKRLDRLNSLTIDTKIDKCFKWIFLNKDAIALRVFNEEKYLITVSLKAEQIETNYKKKQFGV